MYRDGIKRPTTNDELDDELDDDVDELDEVLLVFVDDVVVVVLYCF